MKIDDLRISPHDRDKKVPFLTPIRQNAVFMFRLGLQMYRLTTNHEYTIAIELYSEDLLTYGRTKLFIHWDGPWIEGHRTKKFTYKYDPINFISYILSDSVWVNLSENMVHAFIQPIRKAKRLFHSRIERFDQSQRTHQKQPCFRQLCVFITAFILVALSKS